MSTLADEAIDGLTAVVASLLPAGGDPALRPLALVSPLRIAPTGLGGFVGLNDDPPGDILGRRLKASVAVTVRASTAGALNDAVKNVTKAFLAADRQALLEQGILKLALEEVGPAADGNGASQRELRFTVLYEFVKRPSELEGGVIEEVPLDLDADLTGRMPRRLLTAALTESSLEWFEVVDDPKATKSAPSAWRWIEAEEAIGEISGIWGGVTSVANANKPGTYLVLRAVPGRPPVRNFVLRSILRSRDDRGIGLVFRWRDVDNFYFFLMDNGRGYRMLCRKLGGTFEQLATPAIDTERSYRPGHTYRVKLVALGSLFRLFLDGDLVLEGEDPSLAEPGRVGFMSHANDNGFFYWIDLREV